MRHDRIDSVRFGIVKGQLAVSIWDNTSDAPVLDEKLGSGFAGEVTVAVVHSGKQLVISVNGKEVGTVADHGVFDSGHVWFGADAELGGLGWTLASAHAKPSGAGAMHPQPDVYEFAEADGIVAFAKANGIAVHAHTLVWKEGLAPWMRQVTDPTAVQKMMLDHVDNVAGHFKGQVAEWDVINEPMDDANDPTTQGLFSNIWFKAMGEQYIDIALKEAKKIDPRPRSSSTNTGARPTVRDGTTSSRS